MKDLKERILEILDNNDEYFKDESSPAIFPYRYSHIASGIESLIKDVLI
jgi:hypothetical protein